MPHARARNDRAAQRRLEARIHRARPFTTAISV